MEEARELYMAFMKGFRDAASVRGTKTIDRPEMQEAYDKGYTYGYLSGKTASSVATLIYDYEETIIRAAEAK